MTGEKVATGGTSGQRPPKKNMIVFAFVVLVVLVPVFLFFVGPLVLSSFDRAHIISVDCAVASAKSSSSSTRSTKGIGTSTAQVVISSPDCGTLVLRSGVTRDNRAEVASRLSEGGRYVVRVGEGSYKLRGLLHVFGVSPEASSLRPPVLG